MASARRVALALVLATGMDGVVRAQAPWPAEPPPPTWPPDLVQAPKLAPAADQQACVAGFAALRSKVERAGLAAKDGAEKRLPRKELCKLVTAYSVAEISRMTYAEMNMTRCSLPKDIVVRLKTVHARTADGQKKLCVGGTEPQQPQDLRDDYRLGPLTQPIDVPVKSLPRFSGR